MHGKEVPSPRVSSDYLQSYMQSLNLSKKCNMEEIIKGKMPMMEERPVVHERVATVFASMAEPTNEQGRFIRWWAFSSSMNRRQLV